MNALWSELNTWAYGAVSALVLGIIALVRRLITNEKQIELLKTEIKMREEYRHLHDQRLDANMQEMRTDIKLLIKQVGP